MFLIKTESLKTLKALILFGHCIRNLNSSYMQNINKTIKLLERTEQRNFKHYIYILGSVSTYKSQNSNIEIRCPPVQNV